MSDLDGTQMSQEAKEFDALYERWFSAVWSYVVSRVGHQAAEDVVSETFAVAWRRRADIPPDVLPWLLRVARNVVFASYRREARRRLLDAELRSWIARAGMAEPDVAESVVDRDQALIALASLSDSDRELLILIAWHGLSPRRAAHVLGCSRPAFFVRLHRARGRLERALRRHVAPRIRPISTRSTHSEDVSR